MESGKIIIADNLIHNVNHFLQITNQFILNFKEYGNSNSRNYSGNKSSDKSVKNAFSNSLLQIKKLRIKNAKKKQDYLGEQGRWQEWYVENILGQSKFDF